MFWNMERVQMIPAVAVARGIGAEKAGLDEAGAGLDGVVDAIAKRRSDIPRIIADANRIASARAADMKRAMQQ